MSDIRRRLEELGLELPPAPRPVASYVPAVRSGNLVFTAGQIPVVEGQVSVTGPVPSRVGIEDAAAAARQCGLNALAVIADALDGDLDRVEQVVRLGVFVQSDPGFGDQPKVANGASELMQAVFGDRGRHARAAVGVIGLPLDATVEVEVVVAVRE